MTTATSVLHDPMHELANVLGVPLGTALGDWAGWRSTFAFVAALGVLAMMLRGHSLR